MVMPPIPPTPPPTPTPTATLPEPETWTGGSANKPEDKNQYDEWGNKLLIEDGVVKGALVREVGTYLMGADYEAYKMAKEQIAVEQGTSKAIGFYEQLGGEGAGAGAPPALPEGVPSFVTEDWFAVLPASVQNAILKQQGFAGEGAGAAPPLLSQGEERMLIDLQNAIKIGEMDEGQAWKVIENYWSKEATQTRRAEDATRRGETLLAGAHAGPNLPMTGPGGMGAGLQQKYGLPNLTPGVQGLPGSQALGVFGQAQEQLGLPAQLPPLEPPQFQLPNWQAMGQAMPNLGGANYFDQLLKEGRMTAPGL